MIAITEKLMIDGWEYTVEILSDNKDHWMSITARSPQGDEIIRLDANFQSLRALSSSLRCTLGLRDAEAVLQKAGVPQQSDLWFLNYR